MKSFRTLSFVLVLQIFLIGGDFSDRIRLLLTTCWRNLIWKRVLLSVRRPRDFAHCMAHYPRLCSAQTIQ